ncbi:extracellular matrix protein 1-like [Nelusetta ayraudi]|uniref:extracellular matrix protein 1-like n=1 Tax=Nelusetta ayraudi TaxID=303726 RepID=UPI003F728826
MAVNFPPSFPALRLIATSAAAAVKTLPDRHTQSDSAGLRRRPVESARFIGRRCACAPPQSSQSSSRTAPCKQTDPDPQQQDAARMDFSTLLICATAIVLVSQSSAARDEGQSDVTSELDKIMQERHPDSFFMQRELDLSELLDPAESAIKQREVVPNFPNGFVPRDPPGFGVRSFGGAPIRSYEVQFPLARPSSGKLQAICLHSERRPRYPQSYFPRSGFGQLKRRGSAVNRAETWFTTCCQNNETWPMELTLCCVTKAWDLSVKLFCEEEFSVKDRHYDCCKLKGSNRIECFNNNAPNPNYDPTEALPVPPLELSDNSNFDHNVCQRLYDGDAAATLTSVRGYRRKKVKEPSSSLRVDINFPPARPRPDTIDSLCRNQKLRPLYAVKCLSGVEYQWLALQAKTVNRLEKGFKQCCKSNRNVLDCADNKWRQELDRYCRGDSVDFQCCSPGDGAVDRYTCFQNIAPSPHYNTTSPNEELSLEKVCDLHKVMKKKLPAGFALKTFVNQCCPLSGQERSNCFDQRLQETAKDLCLKKKVSPPAVRRCCRTASQDASECVSNILMEAITKAANSTGQKKRKRCPLS